MPADHPGQVEGEVHPSDVNVPSLKSEQIQDFVDLLADRYTKAATTAAGEVENAPLIGRSLDLYQNWLKEAHQFFRKATHQELTLTYASEWVLDNDYIIRQALRQIREDLPPGYYARLPRLQTGPLKGLPRIYGILVDILGHQRLLVSINDIENILSLLQEHIPLTMGELWAVPTFLRYGLIAGLAHALAMLLRPNSPPDLPNTGPDLPDLHDQGAASRPDPSGSVASAILSLRAIAEQNWNDFFEAVSRLESILRTDPAGIYHLMDFKSRDLYRKEIEKIAIGSDREENELAELTIAMAREAAQANGHAGVEGERRAHVGEYLVGQGRPALEQRAGYHPRGVEALRCWVQRHATPVYLGGILLFAVLLLGLARLVAGQAAGGLLAQAAMFVLLLVPAFTIATSLVNWLVTLLLPPRLLPKLSFREGVPQAYTSLVAIPAMLTGKEEIDSLVRQLEMHFLRNSEPGLLFALLTDFGDSDREVLEEDQALLDYAVSAIRELNARYERADGSQPFFFLHRPRKWNPSEGKWIGWERKRGKLHELNQLILGKNEAADGAFMIRVGDLAALRQVRFVLTADADTVLPRNTASRMAGTLAHPLNQAIFDPQTGKVTEGYTILQPRMEISPTSANRSWFTRIFAGDTGLDLYTLAVSDAYQDLFGAGIFVGKGMYDVAAFERSTAGRIPENTVLSHDLLEGLLGRAALVTDITMIEDYPPNYFVQTMRMRRWVRGDWQLLPWLIPDLMPGMVTPHPPFSAIDRLKIIDNLRRSLLAPSLAFLFALGVLALPQLAGLWLATLLITLGIPVLTSLAHGMKRALSGELTPAAFRPAAWDALRWLLGIAFLPYEAYLTLDAILTTLARVLITHRNLLQWTTAAQTAKFFGNRAHRETAWQKLGISTLIALGLAAGIQLIYQIKTQGAGAAAAPALWAAAPVLLLWALMPLIVREINRPIYPPLVRLAPEQNALLRRVTRRTWGFFERFVGPEDHWLPPDHYQEWPVGIVAHQTSPTNIGLLLTSTLAAYDLGYLDPLGLATRLTATMDNLEKLERYRGHFLNWYDTLTLQPLQPRYVSTVDSGNLAACLIVLAEACKHLPDQPIFRWEMWQGYLDTLDNLSENVSTMRKGDFSQQIDEIRQHIDDLRGQVQEAKDHPERWYSLYQVATGPFWQELSRRLMGLIDVGKQGLTLENLRRLQEVAGQIERHHLAVQRTITTLVPWISLMEDPPALLCQGPYQAQYGALCQSLPYSPSLNQVRGIAETTREAIHALRQALNTPAPRPAWDASENLRAGSPSAAQGEADRTALTETEEETGQQDEHQQAMEWLESLERAISSAVASAGVLLNGYSRVTGRAEQYVRDMDFRFLYHPERRVFRIGYNLDAGLLDNNDYDLLASESRITSLIAIAYGDVPQNHWLHLSRPVTRVEGQRVLLSWSATMFEYLMPPLFLPSYPGTLLAESEHGATLHQIAYGKSKGVPWGMSESGFYRFDSNQNYQYRAFGVPGLGFKRGLGDDLVIAPYASLMAIGQDPHAVHQNTLDLIEHRMLGVYGFYEAIDFTADRLLVGQNSALVREYMAHHQGMIMLSMVNYFQKDIMVRRMMSNPRIQSIDLLLQEQVPLAAPLQSPTESEVKGVQRPGAAPVQITPWTVPVNTPIPQLQLLSNGSYSVLISNAGGGYSTWQSTDLTRWQPDSVLDPWGAWIYIQEHESTGGSQTDGRQNPSGYGRPWSACYQPAPEEAAGDQVTFFTHMAVYRRSLNGITASLEVAVAPDDPVEMRVLHLTNSSDRPRRLRVTSYGEVILTQQANDARHPAFNKLFIESEWAPEYNLQIYKRRPRSENEPPIFMGHMLVTSGRLEQSCYHEADRARFIGRGADPRFPDALRSHEYLTGASGATLDPIFALGQEMELGPHANQRLAYLTFAGDSREEILDLAHRYQDLAHIERTFHQADLAAHAWVGRQNLDTQGLKDTLQVLSALVYPFSATRIEPEVIAANTLGQAGLWRFGVSGDYPILLVQVDETGQVDLVREAIQVHRYLRSRHFLIDLVILNRQQTNYGAELNGMLYRLVSRMNSEQWLNQRGGVYILYADQMRPDERTLLLTAARVVLTGGRGSLNQQLPGYSIQVQHLPEFTPTRIPVTAPPAYLLEEARKREALTAGLLYFNGHGGFSPDGREYLIDLPPRHPTPAPWANVIGYPHFGFMVTEAGSQCTWALNSGENRLTPWSNDPIRDPSGEVLYLRDEETGELWTPTPLPTGEDAPYQVRHGAGYSIFEHESHGLKQRLTLFASPQDPVKIIQLRVENTWANTRRITATQFVDWVLGTTHAQSQPYLVPEYDTGRECLLARNPFNAEFSQRAAFLAASKSLHGLTADRTEFIGRNGSLAHPISFRRLGLERRITPGEDPCGVLQIHLDLPPGSVEEIYFLLGQGDNTAHAQALVEKYHDPAQVQAAWQQTQDFWQHKLEKIQVRTPEPAVDLILNRWLLYQALSCRIWGRTAFYQSSGAFGFRDQLQDVLALLPVEPGIARAQILNAARRQFDAGDVLHWWHPPAGRGVRTRFSDDLLWLPYVTALYVEATGDAAILAEKVPFLLGPPLKPGEDERYGQYEQSTETYTLFEHCRRAIEKGSTHGAHGLPLMGTGDWNDGMNRVGEGGQGESVWLAWFLCDVLRRFAAMCETLYLGGGVNAPVLPAAPGQAPLDLAAIYRQQANDYAAQVEHDAWDGAWYRRAYYDDGAPLGSSRNLEARIDSIAQSWAVLSGMGNPARSHQAMQSVLQYLVRPEDRLILLFTPPFDQTPRDPGYIKGYPPGIRENGGQYTHGAIWSAWAFAALRDGAQAGALFDLLNPVFQADSAEKAAVYRVEPYVVCADIYSVPPHVRRGGWTWYTGSAAWLYRLGLEAVLGLAQVNGNFLRIDPVIPPTWDGFEITYRFGQATYQIQVRNPQHVAGGVKRITLDGLPVEIIQMDDDGQAHRVEVELGEEEKQP